MSFTESAPHFTIDEKNEWHLNLAELRKIKLLVGGPCYDAIIRCTCHKSDMLLQALLHKLGISHAFQDFYNESSCSRGRNLMAAHMMKDGYTHFFSRDADIEYDANDAIRLLAMNLGMVGIVYPKKGILWDRMIAWLVANPNRLRSREEDGVIIDEIITPAELEAISLDYILTPVENPARCNQGIEVKNMGDGCMMFKREVFQRMIDDGVSEKLDNPMGFAELAPFYYGHFTDAEVRGQHLSCDFAIMERWRQCGGKVWAYPYGKCNHLGSYNFRGGAPLANV